jgi:hypothetical protein
MRTRIPKQLHLAALALLIVGSGVIVAACQTGDSWINVVQKAGLESTTRIEILKSTSESPTNFVMMTTINDSATIQELVEELDRRSALGPPAACLPQYQLRFQLADGQVEEFDYYCEDGTSFLRGSQLFWRMQEIQPPTEFDLLMARLVAGT